MKEPFYAWEETMSGKCEHGLTLRECFTCASPKYPAPCSMCGDTGLAFRGSGKLPPAYCKCGIGLRLAAGRAERAEQGWERECDDVDKLLGFLGLDAHEYRTEGGSLNLPKFKTFWSGVRKKMQQDALQGITAFDENRELLERAERAERQRDEAMAMLKEARDRIHVGLDGHNEELLARIDAALAGGKA